MVPVSSGDDRLRPKTWVLGLLGGGQANTLALEPLGVLNDEVEGTNVVLFVQVTARSTLGYHPGKVDYWFAWRAFHTNTIVYEHNQPTRGDAG